VSDELRAFAYFWRLHGQKRILIESGVGSTEEACTGLGHFSGCCSSSFDFGGLADAIVELGGWTADTDHEHRWGSKRGKGWKLCRVPGCRMFLNVDEKVERLPDDYDDGQAKDEPCPA